MIEHSLTSWVKAIKWSSWAKLLILMRCAHWCIQRLPRYQLGFPIINMCGCYVGVMLMSIPRVGFHKVAIVGTKVPAKLKSHRQTLMKIIYK